MHNQAQDSPHNCVTGSCPAEYFDIVPETLQGNGPLTTEM